MPPRAPSGPGEVRRRDPRARRWAALGILVAAGALAVGGARWITHRESRPPDLVLVVWDTCRGDRVTVDGCPLPTTPGLEAFAGGAVVFRQAFTTSPWTPPSHASMFTGLLPRNHGLQGRMGAHVSPGITLLADTLKEGGYETVAFVANPQVSEVTGLDRGFERFTGLWQGEGPKGTGEGALRAVDRWLAERAARKGRRRPAFVFVNLMETHIPYTFAAAARAALTAASPRTAATASASKV